jgi:hypothetical protein
VQPDGGGALQEFLSILLAERGEKPNGLPILQSQLLAIDRLKKR